MAEYKSYINALKQCAKEHKNDNVPFANIRTTDLCNDTADLLEKLENGINETIKQINNAEVEADFMNEHSSGFNSGLSKALEIIQKNIGE